MRKYLAVVLTLLVMLTFTIPSMSESSYTDIRASALVLNRYADVLGCRFEKSDYYCLIRPDGTKITDAIYTSVQSVSDYPFFRVEVDSEDGIHCKGIIDSEGNVIVPAKYANVTAASEHWAFGITLTPSSADDNDYSYTNFSTGEKTFYRIDTADFYFRGQLVGTLSRSDFDGYANAYGDYICVPTRERVRKYYNSSMTLAPEIEYCTGEYTLTYRNGSTYYIHNGTGQEAFEEGCSLTPEEVSQSIVYDRGVFLNLQGEEVAEAQHDYDVVRDFQDGYAVVYMDGKYGLIDSNGTEIIPVEYDDIGHYSGHYLEFGEISAVKDGKFGFLDAQGNTVCDFSYSSDAVQNYGTMAAVRNTDGTTVVLTGLAGELPEHYQDVYMNPNGRAFTAQNADGEWTLIGINGETLIPYGEGNYIEVNRAATVAVCRTSRKYRIYTFTWDNQGPDSRETGESTDTEVREPWDCPDCGKTGNTGKFCGNCGNPPPESTPELTSEPASEPTPNPTAEPTPELTPEPAPEPTSAPTAELTPEPAPEPTPVPTAEQKPEPTAEPTPKSKSMPDLSAEPGEIGSIVRFGHYEQDNKKSTGKEAIEWIVLDLDGNKALLLSRYVLATQTYNNKYTDVSWHDSKVRQWLNSTFIKDAFSSKEQKAILETRLNNGFNQQKKDRSLQTEKGANTTDKVFLLSYKDANKYLKTAQDRMAKATPQALARNTWTETKGQKKGYSIWMLRATGSFTDAVDQDGEWTEVRVDLLGAGIRPALWVDMSSGLVK